MKSNNFTKILFLFVSINFYSQQVTNGFSMPESVTSDGTKYFISNQGQDFINKDGDGFISEIDNKGNIINLKFLPKDEVLNAPKGMCVVNDILYVADLDRVAGFDIKSKLKVFELIIPNAIVLNDICIYNQTNIIVTETASGNIFRINIKSKTFENIGNIPASNGVSYNDKTKQLIVCTNGKNYGEGSIYLKNGNSEFIKLKNIPNGFFDGIEWLDDDNLLISDWVTFPVKDFGKLWIYNLKSQQAELLFTGESIADIYYDKVSKSIYMPQMFHNKLIISNINQLRTASIKNQNNLYNYGVIESFIGGGYEGTLPIKELQFKGDFGLGAPDMLDGELTLLDGITYQTKATGKTTIAEDKDKTSFASVTFFKTDTIIYIKDIINEFDALENINEFDALEKIKFHLKNKNGMYAIRVSGKFEKIKTRAFSPVKNKHFTKLSNMLDQQTFFNLENSAGTLVGFYLPEYLNEINLAGFHFHYLSNDKAHGGHVINFSANNLKVEIAYLKSFYLDVPDNDYFQEFEFQSKINQDLKKVEKGQ